MGIPYHPGIKTTVDGMVTRILSRQGQSPKNAVKVQDYGNSVLDWRDVLLVDIMSQGTTMNSGAYYATLRKL
ncbi:hypothetical protein TNCV_3092861 [Trichonephila clavipes]|uniref:Uncharacterized protein n=1 Tax=Trichonephila clavipes TaxID=2585209 RepID=A0A8X6S304_TRICX|nr:hypothetical protein TNCV_3092861 [Trichonephila clavipes]